MKIAKICLTATMFLAVPVMGYAGCAGHQEATMTCSEGTQWDPETRTCVTISS